MQTILSATQHVACPPASLCAQRQPNMTLIGFSSEDIGCRQVLGHISRNKSMLRDTVPWKYFLFPNSCRTRSWEHPLVELPRPTTCFMSKQSYKSRLRICPLVRALRLASFVVLLQVRCAGCFPSRFRIFVFWHVEVRLR